MSEPKNAYPEPTQVAEKSDPKNDLKKADPNPVQVAEKSDPKNVSNNAAEAESTQDTSTKKKPGFLESCLAALCCSCVVSGASLGKYLPGEEN